MTAFKSSMNNKALIRFIPCPKQNFESGSIFQNGEDAGEWIADETSVAFVQGLISGLRNKLKSIGVSENFE
jgi:hypothetical protein